MRNLGMSFNRFKNNPLEEAFAVAWEKENLPGGKGVLDYLLAANVNFPKQGEVSERDRVVAATVIQWLGSECGRYFIESVLGRKK